MDERVMAFRLVGFYVAMRLLGCWFRLSGVEADRQRDDGWDGFS
jgi:hypothetical protein